MKTCWRDGWLETGPADMPSLDGKWEMVPCVVLVLRVGNQEVTIKMPHEQFSVALMDRVPVRCRVLSKPVSKPRRRTLSKKHRGGNPC